MNGCTWCHTADPAATGSQAAVDANPDFAHAVQHALIAVRNRREPFTSAEVRAELHNHGVAIVRPNAIGAVIKSAARAGRIRATGDFVPSPVKGQHDRPLRVWVAS